jgi:hypothetical protein
MTSDTYSEPIAQKGRDKTTVYRIFYLKKHTPSGPPAFQDISGKMKEFLIENAIDKETTAYLDRLRDHYHVKESNDLQALDSEGYEPFVLR